MSSHTPCSCFSSLPHGVRPVSILWFALACATVCTCYSASSCRLVTLTYTSDLGNFEGHFSNIDAAVEATTYQVGLGLFTWLRPSFYVDGDDDAVTRAEVGNWREGSCAGYTTLQLDDLLEPMLDAVRIMGVLAVLLSFSVFLFSLMLSCLSLVAWQRCVMAGSCLVAAATNGLVLLFLSSDLCHSMGTDPTVTSQCAMDQGGLVAIASVILWVCAALLTFFFIEPVQEPGLHDKMVAPQNKDNKRQLGQERMRMENKMNWNKATANKDKNTKQSNRRSGAPNGKASKAPKSTKITHSSFSIPKYTREEALENSSEAAQKQKRNKSSGSTQSAPPLTAAAAPIMLSSNQPKRPRGSSVASNRSLEARYIPYAHHEEKKDDNLPLYSGHSHNAVEQDMIIRGVAEKLASNNSQKKYVPSGNESTQYFQAHEQPARGGNPLLDPPALNRADSRSMLSSLTSPSYVGGAHTRNELLSASARQQALTQALEDDRSGAPKNDPLCCGIGF